MEVFMDDFSVYGNSFDECLKNLNKMLKRCVETKLMLNWEKCHFMVMEGIVLGHKISRDGTEVDRAKIDTISRLPPPTSVKSIRSFLGHAGFYRRFIRDFSKITRPMTRLLEKDIPFVFDEECLKSFNVLKEQLVSAPILISPDWSLPFELMCDASDYAVGAVLGQRKDKHFHPIDKRGAENVAADHLSRPEDPQREEIHEEEIGDTFPHESIKFVEAKKEGLPWYCDIVNYLSSGNTDRGDRILRRCVSREEGWNIIKRVHEGLTGGHHGAYATAQKVFDCGFYWPSVLRDTVEFVKTCDACQRTGNISGKDEMPQNPIQVLEVFDVWGIDFMGPFPNSKRNRYILVAIDYMSKWVEAQALPTNEARVVLKFLKKLFSRFGTPKALISDRGTHFCNALMEKLLARYGVTHRLSTAYLPQTSGQVENANCGIKRILEKTIGKNRKD
ncbi:uncharacterized protein LOC110933774 [Helianthus annuus]|uniref:uncharacterized protein LOC110933774 n=1 Tax=Helianthus annuus TaxID=4232 RepID=UPI000B902649|nr:uncharacterized protein LOC110933774 [Helianthus annuus]